MVKLVVWSVWEIYSLLRWPRKHILCCAGWKNCSLHWVMRSLCSLKYVSASCLLLPCWDTGSVSMHTWEVDVKKRASFSFWGISLSEAVFHSHFWTASICLEVYPSLFFFECQILTYFFCWFFFVVSFLMSHAYLLPAYPILNRICLENGIWLQKESICNSAISTPFIIYIALLLHPN